MLGGFTSVCGLIGLGTFVSLAAKTGELFDESLGDNEMGVPTLRGGGAARAASTGPLKGNGLNRSGPIRTLWVLMRGYHYRALIANNPYLNPECAVYELEGKGLHGEVKHFEKPLAMTAGKEHGIDDNNFSLEW